MSREAATARVAIDPASTGAGPAISPDIYGQYVEHLEDCVEPGIMDETGVRRDVSDAVADLGVPAIRWPGGCFADLYHWTDGIGADRPVRPNWHWLDPSSPNRPELESNRFGTHEFLDWCENVGARPYINVNLGTGTLTEALRWLDYCTGSADTADVLTRRANGRERPWTVPYWGIGNETWGTWEAGHTDAATYARTLANWADFFHRYDPNAVIVGVGSNRAGDPDWDRTVLTAAGRHLGLLSLHVYAATVDRPDPANSVTPADPHASVRYFPIHAADRIKRMADLVREHNAGTGTTIGVAVDEWNIRHWRKTDDGYRLDRAAPRTGDDALCAAGMFHAMINHADIVRMANHVFLVNGNAVIDARDGQVRRTTLFDVFRAYRRLIVGRRLDVAVSGPTVAPPPIASGSPDSVVPAEELPERVPVIDAVACRTGDVQRLAIVNRSLDPVAIDLEPGARVLHRFVAGTPASGSGLTDTAAEARPDDPLQPRSCTILEWDRPA